MWVILWSEILKRGKRWQMSFLMILCALSVGEDFIYLYTQSPAVVDYYSCPSYISLLLLVIVLTDYCNYLSCTLLYLSQLSELTTVAIWAIVTCLVTLEFNTCGSKPLWNEILLALFVVFWQFPYLSRLK